MTRSFEQQTIDSLAARFNTASTYQDPVQWVKEDLKVDTYSKQREILRLLEIVPRVVVPSCHSAGKTYTAALATARHLKRHPPGTARVITTAPTGPQVRAVLWNEINKLHEASRYEDGTKILPGRTTQVEWWIGNYMAALGRKPSDYSPETFQGLHAEHMLVIVDEAGGISAEMWTAIETLLTNEDAHVLAIGNPDDPSNEFKDIVEKAEKHENDWHLVRIPAWDTPNFTGEEVAPKLKRVLLPRAWVESRRKAWGEDDPRWLAKVEAKFPDQSAMSIVRIGDVLRALDGLVEPNKTGFEDVQLGVDIAASETGDETVIRERRGQKLLRRWTVQSGEPEDVSDLIVRAQMESGATMLHVDATGVGFGFLSDLRHLLPGVAILPFVAAASPKDRSQFVNRRAEAYWNFREKLRHSQVDLSNAEESKECVSQLTGIQYVISKGKIQAEKKPDIRARTGRSPDDADAVILAFESPDGHGPVAATARAASSQRNAERRRESGPEPEVSRVPRPVMPKEVASSGRGLGRRLRRISLRAM